MSNRINFQIEKRVKEKVSMDFPFFYHIDYSLDAPDYVSGEYDAYVRLEKVKDVAGTLISTDRLEKTVISLRSQSSFSGSHREYSIERTLVRPEDIDFIPGVKGNTLTYEAITENEFNQQYESFLEQAKELFVGCNGQS